MLRTTAFALIGKGNLRSFTTVCLARWCYSTATSPAIDEDICLCLSGEPPHFVNPNLEVSLIPGKGRGLITNAALKLGDLIMCVQPLAITHGKCHEMPEPESLVPQLNALWQQAKYNAHNHNLPISGDAYTNSQPQAPVRANIARAWLEQLGQQIAPHHMQISSDTQSHLPLLQKLLHMPVAETSIHQSTSSKQQDSNLETLAGGLSPQPDMHAIVARNAYGDAYEDFAIVAYKHQQSSPNAIRQNADQFDANNLESITRSHVGLWPHFSLLNHACLSNCVHYVVGSHMVVRAVQDIPAGAELTINYQGRDDFSPAPLRQQLLQEKCTLESHLPAPTSELLAQLHTHTTQHLVPRMMQAIEDNIQQGLGELGKELCDWSARLFDNLDTLKRSLCAATEGTAMDTEVQSALNHLIPSASNHNALGLPSNPTETSANTPVSAELVAAVQSIGGPDMALLCLEACVYDFIELLHQHAQLSGDNAQTQLADPHATLKLCADILHAVSMGGELHAFLTCRLLDEAMASKQDSEHDARLFTEAFATEAAKSVEAALLARYGHVSPELMLQLAKLNAHISHTFVV